MGYAQAGPAGQRTTIFDLMYGEAPLEVSIYTDFEQLEAMRRTNEYQAAAFTFATSEGISKWGIKIRARGKFRRRICSQPPLKLNFDKDDLEAMGLEKDDELKLITQCVPGAEGRDYVLREYLAYRLYQLISPYSFRAQLVRLTFHCTATGDTEKSWGIILEDEKTLEHRLGFEECKDCYGRTRADFEPSALMRATLFEYLIANVDYSLQQARNLLLLQDPATNLLYPVPYDFDFSGLVNASYATPSTDYGQTAARERIFLGYSTDAQLATTIAYFQDQREALIASIRATRHLSRASRRTMEAYVEQFYLELSDGIIRPK